MVNLPSFVAPIGCVLCAVTSAPLQWHLVELLYAYCFTARIFDGVLHDYSTPPDDTLSSSSGKGGSTTSRTAICSSSTAAGGSVGSSGSQNRHQDSMLPRGCTAQDAVAHMEVLTGLLLPPAPAATARACATATLASATASQQQQQHAGTHAGPQSAADAVLNVLTAACKPPLGDARSRTAAVAVLHDVLTILSTGRGGVLLALTDLRCSVLQAADAVVQADVSSAQSVSTARAKSSYKMPYFGKAARMRLTAADRKLLYFSAWANELVPEQYKATAAAVQVQYIMHAGAVGMEAEPMHAPASAASIQGHRVAVLDVGVLGDVSGGLRAAQRLLDTRGHSHGGDVHM